MKAGDLKQSIVFQDIKYNKDNFGSTTTEVIDVISTRCSVRKDKASREEINNEIVHTATLIFIVRIYHDINEKMIILHKNKKYRIISIFTDEHKQQHEITAELINE